MRAVPKGIPIVPFHSPGSQRLANAVAEALAPDRMAAVLKNHGSIVVGEDVKSTAVLAVKLEAAARIQLLSSLFGRPSKISIGQVLGSAE
jgi:ribulose-5-phosphate 4-epimerase/fuculose-1-phosphate aldolase